MNESEIQKRAFEELKRINDQIAFEYAYNRAEHNKFPELCYAVAWHDANELLMLISKQFGLDVTVSCGTGIRELPLEYARMAGCFDSKNKRICLLNFPKVIETIHEAAHCYTFVKFGTCYHDEAHKKAVEEIVSFIRPHLKPPMDEIQEIRRKAEEESANRLGLVRVKKSTK